MFSPSHVFFVNGLLCLKLSQVKNPDGTFSSTGGEIATNKQFLYGTYEWVVKTSSNAAASTSAGAAISGSISGCFAYNTNAMTEIDIEFEGIPTRCNLAQFTSWVGDTNPNEFTQVAAKPPCAAFHSYKFIWRPSGITFYIDDQPVSAHTKVIGNTAAAAIINHWGTNDPNWGGVATPGVDRYLWVKSFSYTPFPTLTSVV
jgi:beta-glucanase (GH16 family)